MNHGEAATYRLTRPALNSPSKTLRSHRLCERSATLVNCTKVVGAGLGLRTAAVAHNALDLKQSRITAKTPNTRRTSAA